MHGRTELKLIRHEFLCDDLNAETVAVALKATARRAGVAASKYSTHSLTSGGATAVLSGQADSLSIKLLGRWVSRCFEKYPVQSATSTRGLSSRMV
ncbi:unnamed protein product [Phytophthora fragariaefolia]|uniref:Unnamed protein product n=1 Tax=Phytophthora fragariaefolia TaxID=1490495 RepID=A0A9W6XQD1_9STRA|nr:unnamed protein product [Phytophthora fragariaefolia]